MALQVKVRRSEDRGFADHDWLKTKHSFSFANYYDPAHMAFRSLRVINEDKIAGGKGFGMHPHENMEIFTYIIEGEIEHKDSMGNTGIIKTGEFQYMSAGSGVYHSEKNSSKAETHLLQIWIEPKQKGGDPNYAELDTTQLPSNQGLTLFASSDGRDDSILMRQEAEIYYGKGSGELAVPSSQLKGAWIQMIKGELQIGQNTLSAGDGAALNGAQDGFTMNAEEGTEFILFRLA